MVETKKECFGVLDKVSPMGEDGFRETVIGCFDCPDKVTCLQAALATQEGLMFRSEILDRAPAGGLLGRIKRWSEKKQLSQLMKEKQGKAR
ncbi:MAG: hypothetical protein GY849_04295, partial [Deltaproteobacteria bacterium]|nr:hypothetical protein [Deltaproteobacteria bacterium]